MHAGFADLAVNGSSDILTFAASLNGAATSYNRTALDLARGIIKAQDSLLSASSLLSSPSTAETTIGTATFSSCSLLRGSGVPVLRDCLSAQH